MPTYTYRRPYLSAFLKGSCLIASTRSGGVVLLMGMLTLLISSSIALDPSSPREINCASASTGDEAMSASSGLRRSIFFTSEEREGSQVKTRLGAKQRTVDEGEETTGLRLGLWWSFDAWMGAIGGQIVSYKGHMFNDRKQPPLEIASTRYWVE